MILSFAKHFLCTLYKLFCFTPKPFGFVDNFEILYKRKINKKQKADTNYNAA